MSMTNRPFLDLRLESHHYDVMPTNRADLIIPLTGLSEGSETIQAMLLK